MNTVKSRSSRVLKHKPNSDSSHKAKRLRPAPPVGDDEPDPLLRPGRLPDPPEPWNTGELGWRYYTYIDPVTK